VDGLYGEKTRAALMKAVADNDAGKLTGPDSELDGPSDTKVIIVCNDGTVNIRTGNGTGYSCIAAVGLLPIV